ncbi:MBL fold metallo-hydrolase [Solemya velesiana gill symbiont]|uniref:MBL fold metallo-hydrolase n=1 Tax=Solemya velesiana gill symbiont TaxID=1918948 RepID=A0A1T2KWE0_9GAMM|nr:MBL fold metallo-hydrolase [Solemya velesiana gill symbiont]
MELSYRDLGQGIYCIETYYQRTNLASCYLVVENSEAALIDTGTANTAPLIMDLLAEKGLAPEQVKYVIPTHVHLDHAGGTGQLMLLLPEATLVCHPFGIRHMIDPAKLQASATAVYGEEQFRKDFGELMPVDEERAVKAVDGFPIDLGGRELVCIDTPGHARHHLCVWDAKSQGFFTGDTFGIAYPELITDKGPFMMLPSTPVQFDPDAWHETLDRMMSFEPKRMYLTHFCAVDNPEQLVSALHRQIDDYVDIAINTTAENRYESLKRQLQEYYTGQLEAHGVDLDNIPFDAILDMDLGLCAQGLDVWMQRREQAT